MAKIEPESLFTLPQDMLDQMESAMKRVGIMKEMVPYYKELGMDTTQMEKDIASLEKQDAAIKKFIKLPPELKAPERK